MKSNQALKTKNLVWNCICWGCEMLTHKHILIFDFETSGLSPKTSQIIELGAILLERKETGYQIKDTLSFLIRCPYPLPEKIVEITHITDEMLASEGINETEAFQQLDAFYDQHALLVAYNIQFDLGFLEALFKKYKGHSFQITNDILDVMAIYKDRQKFPHRLDNAVSLYGIQIPNTHRALDDVKATLEVLKQMTLEKNNISHYVNKIGYNKKYGVSGPRLPHVKYIPQYGGFREIENS
jgi:DNA polymerase III subunit epsilon